MNIVVIPLISDDKEKWFPPHATSLSSLDNFCRLFLPPPDSELRTATLETESRDIAAPDTSSASGVRDGSHPNGFLVVDAGGVLLGRIARYIDEVLHVTKGPEARVLQSWARRLAARRPIPTVRRVEDVCANATDGAYRSGEETAEDLATTLGGYCDAVVAFESNTNTFRLRPSPAAPTAINDLYRSCDLNMRQEMLRATWHWDRDEEEHCRWLGIEPPHLAKRKKRNLAKRNEGMIGNALMFETQIEIVDQYVGQSLCKDLLYDDYWRQCDEYEVFVQKWAPRWLESLCFVLSAWKKAAIASGNTAPRSCTVVTAAISSRWDDVLWFFVTLAEKYLTACLGGEVRFEIRDKAGSPPLTREEMHPRYIFASTRAVQSDRGFDLVEKARNGRFIFFYAEIASKTCHEARHSRQTWTGSGLKSIPRKHVTDADWSPTMSTRRMNRNITPLTESSDEAEPA